MFQEWVDLKPASVHLNPEAMTFDNLGDIFFEKKDVFRNLAPNHFGCFFLGRFGGVNIGPFSWITFLGLLGDDIVVVGFLHASIYHSSMFLNDS